MFNKLSDSPSPDYQAYVHIVNYIAAALAAGIYQGIPQVSVPSPREVGDLNRLWREYFLTHKSEVLSLFRRRRTGVSDDMQDVIRNLQQHTYSLRDPRGNSNMLGVSEYDVRMLIPDMTSSIASISSNPPFRPFDRVDAEVLALCRWFKNDYMRWVDPIRCPACAGPTFSAGTVPPDRTELWDGAARVEVHVCKDKNCATQRRFPRYGKVSTLLRTKEGRCGEWAHLFYVFLRAKGIESRYVWNSEDHVWCEYWSPSLRHWVHVDPWYDYYLEGAINKPLVYALGWGKKQAFCLAFGPYGAEDGIVKFVAVLEAGENEIFGVQTSAVFHPHPVDQSDTFSCTVTFRLTSPPGAGEADGIGIVFVPKKALGLGGYGLGYSGLGGKGDFAVEVDTYRTQDYADDPPTPHISVHSPPEAHHLNSIGCTAPGTLPHLSNGKEHRLQILYRGEDRRVRGYLTIPPEANVKEGTDIEVFNIDIPSANEQNPWFIGVTGSCGGLWQKQEIVNWSLQLVTLDDGQTRSQKLSGKAKAEGEKDDEERDNI
ncbi:peptide-N4-(N-acetyl-beta-glucosaminyl)asparagine amidase [Cryptococcus deuterogattii LA55]|nr:peptide-N4-(N-acetyl-beta-glucosaminyl)asparagine amidase [Cryptococcus deuterogattii LA55]KIR70608.1 peptide-N4-(N-acetyl-beta-glucosaminyl)asparagine amidase [Cryptococcus deuterogattii CA1014]KIR90812.1 peptide-N4-(N-acetyl-beta-glucosaminyl)asparagine amidase [Cryptococcus deuterogattii CBS 10090]KIR97447.1 peptide-N4-(N-acetyl-beta-glucosaminyl)asparagine amidase [Cryptococcus deuterogattii 2001/935-1]